MRTALLAAAAALSLALPASAQEAPAAAAAQPPAEAGVASTQRPRDLEPPFGLAPQSVVDLLNRQQGLTAELVPDQTQPVIRVTGDQLEWLVVFYGCRAELCPDAQFSAAFRNPAITLETVNEWNRTRRYLKASYIAPATAEEPAGAVVQQDVMLPRSVAEQILIESLTVWRNTLPRFALAVGYFQADDAAAPAPAE